MSAPHCASSPSDRFTGWQHSRKMWLPLHMNACTAGARQMCGMHQQMHRCVHTRVHARHRTQSLACITFAQSGSSHAHRHGRMAHAQMPASTDTSVHMLARSYHLTRSPAAPITKRDGFSTAYINAQMHAQMNAQAWMCAREQTLVLAHHPTRSPVAPLTCVLTPPVPSNEWPRPWQA